MLKIIDADSNNLIYSPVAENNIAKQNLDPQVYNNEQQSYTVYGFTRIVENTLKQNLSSNISVVGEITGFSLASSGHMYFSLKDKDGKMFPKESLLRCTFFKNRNRTLRFQPKTGKEVVVTGEVNLYHQRGEYSLNVFSMLPIGEGNLMRKVQEIRERLVKEGLADPTRKKKLPMLPKRLGIVTALSGAVLRDILKQVYDRYPHLEVLISHTQVQGETAPSQIIQALEEIAKPKWACDVIILGRGGGSPEDLMPFNDEALGRAVAACSVPIISAVGHQADQQITDLVADATAATPTDAGKIALPEVESLSDTVTSLFSRIQEQINFRLQMLRDKLDNINRRRFFAEPLYLLEPYYNHLDRLESSLKESFRFQLDVSRRNFDQLRELDYLFESFVQEKSKRFLSVQERLAAYSPLATLQRGFSLTTHQGKIIRTASSLKKGDGIDIQLANGFIQATVDALSEK